MENKQSSIEWLFHKLWNEPKDKFAWYALLNKAKTMHKEEIESAFFGGIKSTGEGWNGEYANGNNPNVETVFKRDYEQYCNETYERKTTEDK